MQNSSDHGKEYLSGLRAGMPVILGYVPVGIAYAIMARKAGLSVGQTCAMSLTVFAGASQMMAIGMFELGADVLTIILTTFIFNLRHLIMSICVMNRIKKESKIVRLLAAYGITDESFAIFTTQKEMGNSGYYFLGLITVTYTSWNVGTLIGAVASNILPEILSASLGISLYAMFIGILMPSLTGSRSLGFLVVLTALCHVLLMQWIPSSWALIFSALICAGIGMQFVNMEDEAVPNESY